MIEFEISAGLGVLRLNSPPVNAISLALLAKLQNAVRRANQEPEVRAIVITGSAGHFRRRSRPGRLSGDQDRRRRGPHVAHLPGSLSGD